MTEASLNGFPSSKIADRIQEHPYRFLVCADKFQTGYDEPLLHTMYVDKQLSGIKAVQTLSRLNRARPQKHDTFVLDFMNDVSTIQEAFEPYYRTTILAEETDANKLHDLKADLDGASIYTPVDIDRLQSKTPSSRSDQRRARSLQNRGRTAHVIPQRLLARRDDVALAPVARKSGRRIAFFRPQTIFTLVPQKIGYSALNGGMFDFARRHGQGARAVLRKISIRAHSWLNWFYPINI